MPVWTGTTMEPFVIGSLWGNLTDDNQATLVFTGTTFKLEDDLQDVWGEVSAGVNFFNPPSATTSTASAARPACASRGRLNCPRLPIRTYSALPRPVEWRHRAACVRLDDGQRSSPGQRPKPANARRTRQA